MPRRPIPAGDHRPIQTWKMPEFEAPKCPKCGAEDPVLESVEPTNTWLCEACGKRWTEPAQKWMEKLEGASQ